MTSSLQRSIPPETLQAVEHLRVPPAKDADVLSYLRRSHKMARAVALAERDAMILKFCEQLGITISNEELQAAADAFRHRYKLLSAAETHSWLSRQKITADDWSEGLKSELLTKKLEERLFGEQVDSHYLTNRDTYKRAAFSQILLSDETEAQQVANDVRAGRASFNAVALERSLGKISRATGGFVGVRFFGELRPEIGQAMSEAKEGEIIGPIQTQLGFHLVRVEKWFPTELTVGQRKRMLVALLKIVVTSIEITAGSDGTELLADNESYMGELAEDELSLVAGGVIPLAISLGAISAAVSSIDASKSIVDEIQGDD